MKIFDQSPDDYVYDAYYIGESFYEASVILLKDNSMKAFIPAGFLAAHAAEMFLKALIIAIDPSKKRYKSFKKLNPKHELPQLLDILKELDSEAKILTAPVNSVNKYSGVKVRYPEPLYEKDAPDSFGSDEIWPIQQIRDYVKNKLHGD